MKINHIKNAIVTGSSRGIGNEVCNFLKEKNIFTIGISRSGSCDADISFKADISEYNELKEVYKNLKKDSIYPNVLINCAGIASMNLALTTPSLTTKKIINTNLIGTIFSCQVFSPLLIKSKIGRIINFSTIAVGINLQGESIYAASKAGVETFTKVLGKELSSFGITVNCIAPGPIKTDLLKGINEKQIKKIVEHQIIKKQFNKSDICEVIELLLSPKSSSISGEIINIGGL